MKKKSYLGIFTYFPILFLICLISMALPLSASSIKPEINISYLEIFDNEFPDDPESNLEMIRKEMTADNENGQGYPSIWNEVIQTDKIHGYIINLAAIPRINEIPLEYGDWIGGFYLRNGVRFCGGARMWTGLENVTVILFGDDGLTPIKDGFSGGELIEFRFFLQSTQKEYVVSIMSYHVQVGYVTNGRWYPTSISMVMNMKAVKAMDFFIQIADNPICINNQVAPSAEEFIGTGGPYTFSWSSDPPGYNHNVQTPPPIVLDVTTDFFLTVTDPNNVSEHQVTVLVYDHPTADAGENGAICANETFAVSGESTNALNVEWTSSGDGVFANPNLATTVYTPGTVDKLNGSVVLTFSADPYSPCSVIDSDDLTLNILPLPSVVAGEDMSACGNETVIATATATNFNVVQWTTSGSGTFSNPNALTTQYNPSGTDIINGVTLTICVNAISPCVFTVCDQMQISYLPGPTAAAPSIIRRCEGITFSISGSVSNNSGVLWTTQGDGTFTNPSVIPAIYTPGPQDIANFGTIVTLNSLPIAPCDIPATKNVTLFIQQLPSVVTFGPNTDYACKNSFLQLAAEAYEYTTVTWSRIGDGTFSSTNVLNPKYYPGTNDKLNGYFTLILSLAPKQHCSVGTTVQKTVQIIDNPTVDISTPSNQLVCADAPFPVTGLANSYQNVLWTSLGDGSFGNQNALTTQYNPGPGDVSSGANIKLTLLASPVAPCEVAAEDFIFVSFEEPPFANAGNNATICENQTYQLNGTANAYSSISWQTSGSGSFSNPGILQPVYTPSAQDALNGNVNLTLISQPNSPCVVAASDQMVLTIQRLSTANAGADATVCENQNHALSGSSQRYSSVLWTTSGTGTFTNPASLSPSYVLSAADKLLPSLTLTLTTQPISPCAVSTSDTKVLTIQQLSTANAGADATICENQTHTLNGSALRYSAVQWTTSGTGTYSNNGILNPVYTPSTADKLAGFVNLTLTAQPISPCAVSTSDTKVLTIQQLSTANAGADATICEDQTHTLNGSALRYSAVQWTTSGTGTYSNNGILNPVYTPSTADKLAGFVNLTLTAQPISPCAVSTSDTKVLTIQQLSTANAGADATICENQTHTLNGSALRYSAVQWTTSGTGSFSNNGILNPVYTPSTADKLAGSLILTLTTQPISPCAVSTSDTKVLTIQQLSTANAGDDATICENQTHTLNGSALRYSAVQWTTSGTGTYSNNGILNPVYTPSTADKLAGFVNLTLTAQPISPCAVSTSDTKVLTIQQLSTANAGADATICEDQTHTLNGSALRYSAVQWTTSGTGTYSNNGILNPVYTPSTADKLAGSLILTLTTQPISPCAVSTSDTKVLTIQQLSTANAGDDATICENQTHTLNGSALRYSAVQWTTSGTGTYSNNGILNPVYTPSTADKLAGFVNLTLTAQPISPCAVSTSDTKVLTIQQLSTANAGADATICENQTHTLNGSALRYSAVQWTTSGTGTYSNNGILNPVYTPSTADKLAGSLILTLTTQPISPCAVSTSDTKVLTIQQLSTANAGADASICENQTHALNGSALRYSAVQWTTSGTGTYSNNGILNPVYTPSTADKLAGFVNLTLTAQPISPCAVSTSDTKVLTIQQLSTANAGADALICGDEPHQLNGQATNYATLLWTTSGTGSFSNPGTLNPTYTPSAADKIAGSLVLTLTAQPISPCSVSAADQKILTIDILEVENDLFDTEVNVGATAVLNFDVTSYTAGTFVWYFDGEIIDNVSGSTLTITNAEPSDAGHYQSIFTNNCGVATSNEVLVEVIQLSTHQMILQTGWSGISSYVTPANPDMENIFAGIVNNLEIISDNFNVFWPGQNINTLGDWSVTKGYKIKMTGASQLDIAGAIRYPLASLTIPTGWSYLPVNSTCAINVAEQFGANASVGMIKDIAGTGIYWPAYGVNTLQQLWPGKAYEIYNFGIPFDVRFPLCDPLPFIPGFKTGQPEIIHPWNEVHKTPASHIFGFIDNAAGVLEQGDIIGGFTQNGICAGITQIDQPGSMIVLTAFATDQLAQAITGFTEGEPLKFVLFRPSTNTEYDLEVSFAPQSIHDGMFTSNGISLISNIELMTTGVGNDMELNQDLQVEVFPNPTTGILNINISSEMPIQGELMISNAAGQVILNSSIEHTKGLTQQSFDLSGNPVGVYYLRIIADEVLETRKIVLR